MRCDRVGSHPYKFHPAQCENGFVPVLTFQEARSTVLREVSQDRILPPAEQVPLGEAAGRVLAEPVYADRDLPALDRSMRDGYAVRSADLPGRASVVGQVRAGEIFTGAVEWCEAVEIMTGAPVPKGTDAVIMLEHVTRKDDVIEVERTVKPGENINPRGIDAKAGTVVLEPGRRIGYGEVALLATVGYATVSVYRKPQVAILATGDELVGIDELPLDYQIRNSNLYSLAAQVRQAGGGAVLLPVARDRAAETRDLMERGLSADLLLISGGVSAGKYDLVEDALRGLGAEFYFDRVAIQPGAPLVFGKARDKFFFGLPGNPVSTMVTFELFARSALDLVAGCKASARPLLWARMTQDFKHRPGLTRFLPAKIECGDITPIAWKGSNDIVSFCRANGFLVADAKRESWVAGDLIQAFLK
jgi:molybdopterin molybdotransferase